MSKASQLIETQAFAERLQLALKGIGIRPSPSLVANEFNLRYWGESITINRLRKAGYVSLFDYYEQIRIVN